MENLSSYSFLIVDDVRTTRIALCNMLSSFGNPVIHNAENGLEAISVLLDKAKNVDCIIADFNMPIMHGLMMTKMVRCGHAFIRRNIPVIMLTNYNDQDLYGIAMELDVNAFLLKPTSQNVLHERIVNVMNLTQKERDWLKPARQYSEVDTDTLILSLLERKVVDFELDRKEAERKAIEAHKEKQRIKKAKRLQKAILELKREIEEANAEDQQPEPEENMICCKIDELPVNAILAKDVYGRSNRKLLGKQARLSKGMIERLKDLREIGEPIKDVWIKEPEEEQKKQK